MALRSVVRRQFLLRRGVGAAVCAALAAAALGGLARADGLAVVPAAAIGAVLGAAYGLRRYLWRVPAEGSIDPGSDPDGRLRAALCVAPEHPFAPRLQREAQSVRFRFRPMEEIGPLAVLATVAWIWSAWILAAPQGSAFLSGDPLAAGGSGPRDAREAGPGAGDVQPDARGPAQGRATDAASRRVEAGTPPGGEAPSDAKGAAAGEAGGAWLQAPVARAIEPHVVAGRDFGPANPTIRRYLEIRAREPR